MKLNLGGGGGWSSSGWTNLDIDLGHNLRQENPLPFDDNSVDVIYSSHCIEHMPANEARRVVAACHRVLKPGGLLRMVAPDCQKFAKAWLAKDELFFTENQFLTPHYPSLLPCFKDMGGNPKDLNEPSGIQHYFFWDRWSMTWLMALCGFTDVSVMNFGESSLAELKAIATLDSCGMPLSGFDNPNTAPISFYVEAVKS